MAKPELIVVHVSDHGKPMKLSNATGQVMVFNGNDKTKPRRRLALAGAGWRPRELQDWC